MSYQTVVIIGAARSGTKLLRDIIASHPQVDKIPYDINYIWRLGNEKSPDDEIAASMLSTDSVQRIRKYFDSSSRGGRYLIEKTVSNCLRVPAVDKVFPDARYIYLHRDGWDVVESVYRQWIAPPDWGYIFGKAISFPLTQAFDYGLSYARKLLNRSVLRGNGISGSWGPRYKGIDEDIRTKELIEVCAIQWSRCVESAANDLAFFNRSRVMQIGYEEFVRDPTGNLERIAAFLDCDPGPYQADKIVAGVSKENIGKGKQTLSLDQQELIGEQIERTSAFLEIVST